MIPFLFPFSRELLFPLVALDKVMESVCIGSCVWKVLISSLTSHFGTTFLFLIPGLFIVLGMKHIIHSSIFLLLHSNNNKKKKMP